MARDAAREGELAEQVRHPRLVPRDVGVDLRVGALEPGVRDRGGAAVPGPGDVDHVQVALFDHPVEVGEAEVQARRGAPVPEQARFDVLGP